MDYSKKISEIVEEALTKKTFSLEIINRIKELKEGFDNAQKDIENQKKFIEELDKKKIELQQENDELRRIRIEYEDKKIKLDKELKENERIRYQLDYQKFRADEIKELFGIVFKNPVILKSVTKNIPYNQNGTYPQTTQITDTEKKEVA